MKNIKILIVSLLVFTALLLSSCGENEINNPPAEPLETETLISFDKDLAPMKTVKTDDYYYSLFGEFNSKTFFLSVSESPEIKEIVYESRDADIWYFDAYGDKAVWCEKSEDGNSFKLYDKGSGVKEIFFSDTSEGYQNSNIAVYKDNAYFSYIDYSRERASVMRYDTKTGKNTELYTFDFNGELSIMNLAVCENKLVVTGYLSEKVSVVISDLDAKSPDITVPLLDVSYVYAVGYENGTDKIAIYYRAKDGSEYIALSSVSDFKTENIYAFAADCYAYQDSIEMHDGKVNWILQKNETGFVADNFSFLSYNIGSRELYEKKNAFYFTTHENDVYLLSFDKAGEYEKIIYSKYKK
jgi:hypothetical protein